MTFATMNGPEFVQTMENLKRDGGELQTTIREALAAALGELPATVALAYTGDAEDGDLESFVRRVDELFGTSAKTILKNIASWATRNAPNS